MTNAVLPSHSRTLITGLRTRLMDLLAGSAVLVDQSANYGDVKEMPKWPEIRNLDKAARGLI